MATNDTTKIAVLPEGMHRISWGAVFAGLVATTAVLWLLFLLGLAIGVSVLDATDAAALGEGLGWGAVIWLLLSFLVAYCIGGAMAGRLSTDPTPRGGMLHGATVWSTAMVLSLILGAWGIGGTASVTSHSAGNVAKASARIVTESGQSLQAASQWAEQFADSALAEEMTAALKSRLAEVLATTAEGVEQEETRQAINEIDAETVTATSRHLIAGEEDKAIEQLTQATNLSRPEINRIVNGLESQITAAIENSEMLDELESKLRAQVNGALQATADFAGPALSASELRATIEQLDVEAATRIATHLLLGETDRAKNVLTANTPLNDQQVNQVIDQVSTQYEEQMQEWEQQAKEVMETASDYTQAVIWSLFFSSLLGLLAALWGGYIGAGRIRQ